MKPLRETREWPMLAVYDIEAANWTEVIVVCHIDEAGNKKAFRNVGFYLEWLASDAFPGEHVWAHWGGHYDHRFIVAEATKRGWSWETIQSGNTLVVVEVRTPRGKILKFCESARLMPDSVEKIGKTIGLHKMDVDRTHLERLSIWRTTEYCFRDCEIVLRGLQQLRDALTAVGADFAYTLASIASRWVRRSDVLNWQEFFADDKKYSPEMLAADEFCEPAYFGGRTEVFKVGTFRLPLFYYDIRSSYPWSMLTDLPAYFRGFRPPPRDIRKALAVSGITDATVRVPGSTYLPVLPVRHGGKLVFPVGEFRGKWTNLELVAALNQGCDLTLHAQAIFEPAPFLAPFVHTFYALRRAAIEDCDEFRKYAWKILLNSCYGKLIETVERQKTIFGDDIVTDAIRKYGIRTPGEVLREYCKPTTVPGVFTVVSESMGPFRHVAAGAYVTARSRLLLHSRMQQILDAGGHLYYCDTDSILTDVQLPAEPDELGALKLEERIVEAEIVVPKVYRLVTEDGRTIYKVKGTPVEKGDNGILPAAESAMRWRKYVAGEAIGREGIQGFANDLRAGKLIPSKFTLSRGLRSSDTKRTHNGEDSTPLRFPRASVAGGRGK